jgi:NADH dehydrogenase [ubiquinone] 1 alpha subcomplex assembly factor 7
VPPLTDQLIRRISRGGPISLAEFMAVALTHPKTGYYMSGDPFGAAGDFVTAPEVSQMFGELIGLWSVDCWEKLGRPDPLQLVELGPGRGSLMSDVLRAARVVPAFCAALRVELVEVSPSLRQKQHELLAKQDVTRAIRWHETLDQVPDGPMILIANEFFDALPIRQFQRVGFGWAERLVALSPDGKDFCFALGQASPLYSHLLPAPLRDAPEGALVEVSSAALSTACEIGRRLSQAGGTALVIDYGHLEPQSGASLQALREHRRQDPLHAPGSADLTAHVDFATLAAAAEAEGARRHGPVEQGRFLQQLGIAGRAAQLAETANPAQRATIEAALTRLTAPEEMGRLFKVLALSQTGLEPLAGFNA